MMKIVSLISQKGGVGKSTLAQALAVEASKLGLSVLLADCDPQQHTSYDWSMNRKRNGFKPYIEAKVFQTISDCLKLVNPREHDLLIIDGPARVSEGTLLAAKNSELLIQPTGSSSFDLVPALREFHSLVKAGVDRNKLIFVANHITSPAELSMILDSCAAANYACFPQSLWERSSFKHLSGEGKALTENSFTSLREQALTLTNSILEKLSLWTKSPNK